MTAIKFFLMNENISTIQGSYESLSSNPIGSFIETVRKIFTRFTKSKIETEGTYDALQLHILNEKLDRLDGGVVLFNSFGLEHELAMFFTGRYPGMNELAEEISDKYIKGKRVLVVPGYGINPFLFKLIGAKEVVGVDADPVTVEWQNAMQKYFYSDELGRDFMAGAGYPNCDALIRLAYKGIVESNFTSQIASRIRFNVLCEQPSEPIEGVEIKQGILGEKSGIDAQSTEEIFTKAEKNFDFIYVPYLLGIKNGVKTEKGVTEALNELYELGHDGSIVMIAPFSGSDPDIIRLFGTTSYDLKEVENLVQIDKFKIENKFYFGDEEVVLLKIKKPTAHSGT